MLLIAPITSTSLLVLPVLMLISTPNCIFFGDAQNLSICDSTRLLRCQQDVLRDIQIQSGGQQIGQYQLGNGPPYSASQISPSSSNYASFDACSRMRANLNCLLITTPACYNQGAPQAQNTDVILRAKHFLEQNQCNQPDRIWQHSYCYKMSDIKVCEDRFGFSQNSPSASSYLSSAPNQHSCESYLSLRRCAEQSVGIHCKASESDMLNEYLIDKASDLAWRCVLNTTSLYNSNSYGSQYNPYGYSQYPSTLTPQSQHFNGYEPQRPIPPYTGLGNQDRIWQRFSNPFDDRYPQDILGRPSFGERLTLGNDFNVDLENDCPNRAAPFTRECRESFVEDRRAASDSRTTYDLNLRTCCAYHKYKDCVSRVVIDRCQAATTRAVDTLITQENSDLLVRCRDYPRAFCSGSQRGATMSILVVTMATLLASLLAFRSSKSYRQ